MNGKNTLDSLLLLLVVLTAKYTPNQMSNKTMKSTEKLQTMNRNKIALFFALISLSLNASAKTVPYNAIKKVPLATANTNITAYANNANKNTKTKQFVFRADELKAYISQSGAAIMQFILGDDMATPPLTRGLVMYPVMVDNDGSHIYLKDANNICYVLGDAGLQGYIPDVLPEVEGNQIVFESANCIANSTAAQYIADYQNPANTTKSGTTYFTYNALELKRYLDACPNVKYVQVLLSQVGTKLGLVFVGYDLTQPFYFKFNNANNIMNGDTPCPSCVVGSTLENCQ
ncbi:MAG: hypothetical protein EBZ77_03205 [Chitinophagia bacterium]|nr:hypothetical protein [Chitinophagia bacterium]